MIDLHQHSTFSDGTDSVEELIRKNKEAGIKVMSITDHDNIGSVMMAKEIAGKVGIDYITGVEFSTQFNGKSVHILCYNFAKDDKVVSDLIKEGKAFRRKRVQKRLELLESEFGIDIGEDAKLKLKQKESPGRPMIANIMIEQGVGTNVSEVIQKYMYHRLPEFELETIYTIQSLNKSSGISVYAHPLGGVGEKRIDRSVFEERLKLFVDAGLKGMECYYSLYSKEEQEYLVGMAQKYNLLITGGSDYHGKNKDVKIGELINCGKCVDDDKITLIGKIRENLKSLYFYEKSKMYYEKYKAGKLVRKVGTIIKEGNKYLTILRKNKRAMFAGGTVDDGETAREAAIREAFEECGAKVVRLKFLQKEYYTVDWEFEGEVFPNKRVSFTYLCAIENADISLQGLDGEFDEGTTLKWCTLAELEKYRLCDSDLELVKKIERENIEI